MIWLRRTGLGGIVIGSLYAAACGVLFVVWGVSYVESPGWAALVTGAGLAMLGTALVSGVLAARDMRAGRLSERGEWWTWTATLAFALPWLATLWFFWLAFLGALAPFVAVPLARGRGDMTEAEELLTSSS